MDNMPNGCLFTVIGLGTMTFLIGSMLLIAGAL